MTQVKMQTYRLHFHFLVIDCTVEVVKEDKLLVKPHKVQVHRIHMTEPEAAPSKCTESPDIPGNHR